MNWAMGQGSSGGRCARSLGKWRIRTRTSSLLTFPEIRQQLALFLGRQQVRREHGHLGIWGVICDLGGHKVPLLLPLGGARCHFGPPSARCGGVRSPCRRPQASDSPADLGVSRGWGYVRVTPNNPPKKHPGAGGAMTGRIRQNNPAATVGRPAGELASGCRDRWTAQRRAHGRPCPFVLQSHPIVKAPSRQFKGVSQKIDEKLLGRPRGSPAAFAFSTGEAISII